MRTIIKSIRAHLIDASTHDGEVRFLIPFWEVGYEIHTDRKDANTVGHIISGTLNWKAEPRPELIIEYLHKFYK